MKKYLICSLLLLPALLLPAACGQAEEKSAPAPERRSEEPLPDPLPNPPFFPPHAPAPPRTPRPAPYRIIRPPFFGWRRPPRMRLPNPGKPSL